MAKMYIPHLGAKIKLTADWTFKLYNEYRNKDTLYQVLGIKRPEGRNWPDRPSVDATIPAGTILTVDRIYIRGKGADQQSFNSLTFRINKGDMPGKTWKGIIRFWAKLDDINGEMEYEEV